MDVQQCHSGDTLSLSLHLPRLRHGGPVDWGRCLIFIWGSTSRRQQRVGYRMFFKRSQPGATGSSPVSARGEVTTVAATPQPLEVSELRRVVSPSSLGFKTTDELVPITGLIGQDRALKAIQFGANIKSHDFNMFVLGPPASGKSTAVRAHLGPRAAEAPPPPDWVYVYNFDTPNRPKALKLPHGRAQGAGQGHDRRARRVAQRAAGPLRGRGLSGAPARHRRTVPVGQRGGPRCAEQEGAITEHRAAAYANRLRHGADARGQGRQARGVQRPPRGDAPRRREQDRSTGEGAGRNPGTAAANRTRSGARTSAN